MALSRWITLAVVATALLALATFAVAQRDAESEDEDGARAANAQAANAQEEKAPAAGSVETFVPPDLAWEDNPDVPGVQSAIGVGDPTGTELYTMFGKMDEDVRFPAHTHPDARLTTVLSGTMYYGVGESFDGARLEAYPAGSVVYTPPNTPHVMWAKDGETIMQETGHGPTGLEVVSGAES